MKKLQYLLIAVLICVITGIYNTANAYSYAAIEEYNKGIDYSQKGEYDLAIDSFLKSVTLDPSFVDSYYNLGSVYEYIGELENAIISFEKLLSKKPKDYESSYKLATLCAKNNNYEKSLKYINIIPEDNKFYPEAQALYKEIFEQAKALQGKKNTAQAKPIQTTLLKNFQGPTGIAKDSNNNLYVASYSTNTIWTILANGKRQKFVEGSPLNGPIGLVCDRRNNLYSANYVSGEILKISPLGVVTSLMKNIQNPYYLYIDGANILHISEQGTGSIIKVDLNKN
ncbi:MAG: tetratricopeptide repeat protein [Candidatus Gastranaerophilales bacterium]|nr:tetratricopeptide repeat protein [Candidatus Gastranaerophilales bacterium]